MTKIDSLYNKNTCFAGRRPQTMRTAALGLPPYTIFTLEEIEEATNNFDSVNLVGEGSQTQVNNSILMFYFYLI